MSSEETPVTQTPRPLDILQAAGYPFKERHRLNGLLFPGLVYLVYMIFAMAAQTGLRFLLGFGFRTADSYADPVFLVTSFACSYLGLTLILSPLFGYVWELAGVLRKQGYDAPPPAWFEKGGRGNFLRFWVNGFKFMLFSQIVSAPVVLPYLLVYFFAATHKHPFVVLVLSVLMFIIMIPLGPFMYGSMIQTSDANDKSFVRLFDFKKILAVTLPCYWKTIGATLIYFLLLLLMIPALMLTCCTCIGYPFALAYLIITFFHLVIQSYDACRPEIPETTAIPANTPDTGES